MNAPQRSNCTSSSVLTAEYYAVLLIDGLCVLLLGHFALDQLEVLPGLSVLATYMVLMCSSWLLMLRRPAGRIELITVGTGCLGCAVFALGTTFSSHGDGFAMHISAGSPLSVLVLTLLSVRGKLHMS